MKLATGILTLAVSLALGACASDNMTWHDTAGNPDMNRTTVDTSTTGVSQSNVDAIHQVLPDNPQLGGGNDKNITQGLSDVDRQFMVTAMQSGQFEVTSGEKALAMSNNPGVKSLAQYIIDDHTKLNGQAMNIASRRGLRAPVGLSTDQIDKLAQLDKLNGADFDSEYLRQQRQAHDDAIALFSAAASSANDKYIRDWAAATVPALRNHREMIDALNGNNNNTMNNNANNTNNTNNSGMAH